jgi:uncharacterized protein
MKFEFDSDKNEANHAKHGVSLADFEGFDTEPMIVADKRTDYGEARYRAFGLINGVGHCLAFTVRGGNWRLISFRRAHQKEMHRHEKK